MARAATIAMAAHDDRRDRPRLRSLPWLLLSVWLSGMVACGTVQGAELGSECNDVDGCTIKFSICKEGKCTCSEGYEERGLYHCVRETNCDIIEGIGQNCKCQDEDYIIDGSYTKCLKVAFEGYGAECEDNRQCSERMGQGALCESGACKCAEGFHYLHGECWKSKDFGEACKEDADCYAFAESDAYACTDGKCACAEGAHSLRPGDSPLCRRVAQEGEECESTNDCEENLSCEKRDDVDALDYICKISTSTLGISYALQGMHAQRPKKNNNTSVATAEASQCGTNEEPSFSGKTCVCKLGYFRTNSMATCLPELGEPCSVSAAQTHEYIQYSTCRRSAKHPPGAADRASSPDGVWGCLGGFVGDIDNHVCQKTRKINNNCQTNTSCSYYGGKCITQTTSKGSCKCEDNHHYDATKLLCWPSKGLDEKCTSLADCVVETAGSVECDSSTEICRCKNSYHRADNDCRKDANKIGDSCSSKEDCIFALEDPTITCSNGICSCIDDHFAFNNTKCQVGIGGNCESDSDCSAVSLTTCSDGQCQCSKGYVSGGPDACLSVATEYGGECEDDKQCSALTDGGELMTCSKTTNTCVCSCSETCHYRNRTCWVTRRLDEKCDHQSECIANRSLCLNRYCTCDFGYKADGNTCIESAATHLSQGYIITSISIIFISRVL